MMAQNVISAIADTRPEKVNDEARLFDDLFVHTRYDNSVRPVRNKASSVQVYLDVALVQLVDLVSQQSAVFYGACLPHRVGSTLLQRWGLACRIKALSQDAEI